MEFSPLPFERLIYQEIDHIRQAGDGRIPDDTLRRLDYLFQHDPILEIALEHIDNNDITRCTSPSGRYYYQVCTSSSSSAFRSSSSTAFTGMVASSTINIPNNNNNHNKQPPYGLTPVLDRNISPSASSSNHHHHHYHEPYTVLIHGTNTTPHHYHHYCSCLRYIVQNTYTESSSLAPFSTNPDSPSTKVPTLSTSNTLSSSIDLYRTIELPIPFQHPSPPSVTNNVGMNPILPIGKDDDQRTTATSASLPIYHHSFCKHLLAVLIADALGEERYRKQDVTEEQLIESLAR